MDQPRKAAPTPDLERNIAAMLGRKGIEWLEALPEIVGGLEKKWSVVSEPPFAASEYNFVAPATLSDGSKVVLKIAPPVESPEIFGEARYLKTCGGRGCVRLLNEDKDARAILIERALPGENFADFFRGRESESLRPAIDILRRLYMPTPADTSFIIELDDWFDGLRRFSTTDFPAAEATDALAIYDTLSRQSGRISYLHGDFHPGNLVTAEKENFKAIDPKGMIGHLGYEIAVYLNNFNWWLDGRADIEERLDEALAAFSGSFEISVAELREWAFAQMVLSAWWTFDEMPDIYSDEVQLAKIWRV